MLTHARLLELVHYEPETGIFTWKARPGKGHRPGKRIGTLSSSGYLIGYLDYSRYPLHRVAWFYMTGRWPTDEIDHKNRQKTDNHFANLREATHGQNTINGKTRCDNTSGYRGVHVHNRRNTIKYSSAIGFNGKQLHLGTFDTPEAAYAAYCKAAETMHGEFATHARK
jgi:HNH endonuclease/AP2 domain